MRFLLAADPGGIKKILISRPFPRASGRWQWKFNVHVSRSE